MQPHAQNPIKTRFGFAKLSHFISRVHRLSFLPTVILLSLQTIESILCLRDKKSIQPVRIISSSCLRFEQVHVLEEALNNSWFFLASFPQIITILSLLNLSSVSQVESWCSFCYSSEVIVRSFVKVRGSLSNPDLFKNITKHSSWIKLDFLAFI